MFVCNAIHQPASLASTVPPAQNMLMDYAHHAQMHRPREYISPLDHPITKTTAAGNVGLNSIKRIRCVSNVTCLLARLENIVDLVWQDLTVFVCRVLKSQQRPCLHLQAFLLLATIVTGLAFQIFLFSVQRAKSVISRFAP